MNYMLLLTEMVFFEEKRVSSTQLNRPIWRKQSLSPPETPKMQEVFLSNTNPILTGKQYATCSCFSHRWFSCERYMCFFNLAE
jgi:hypothetical protein